MRVKSKGNTIAGIVGLISLAAAVCAAESSQTKIEDKAMTDFKRTFPGTVPSKIEKVPVDELFEVTAGDRVFYYSPGNGLLILGEMYSKDGVNLTAEKKKVLTVKKLETLPFDKAVKIGNGPIKVIEITDPDCPYCRIVDKALENRTDITRYIFFFPLRQIHPQSADKAAFIASQPDATRERVFREVFSGKYDTTPVPRPGRQDQARVVEMEKVAASLGVKGTPTLWIDNQSISSADIPRINALLSAATGRKEATSKR